MVLKPVPLNVPVKLAMAPRSGSGCAASAARPRRGTDGTCPHRKPRVRSRAGSVGTVSVMTQYHILFLLPNGGQMVPGHTPPASARQIVVPALVIQSQMVPGHTPPASARQIV